MRQGGSASALRSAERERERERLQHRRGNGMGMGPGQAHSPALWTRDGGVTGDNRSCDDDVFNMHFDCLSRRSLTLSIFAPNAVGTLDVINAMSLLQFKTKNTS